VRLKVRCIEGYIGPKMHQPDEAWAFRNEKAFVKLNKALGVMDTLGIAINILFS
jgi:hypothetical protein